MYKYIFIIFLIIIITSFHLYSFYKINNKYEILQINNINSKISLNYFKENLPICILNHKIINIYNYISPLTIKKKLIDNTKNFSNKYLIHNKDSLFIYATEFMKIYLSIPNQIKYFCSKTKIYSDIYYFKKKNNNFNFIEIILQQGNILYIPRNWIFFINSQYNYKIFYTHTIFSGIFTFYSY